MHGVRYATDSPFFHHLPDFSDLRGPGAPPGLWHRGGGIAGIRFLDDDDCLGADDGWRLVSWNVIRPLAGCAQAICHVRCGTPLASPALRGVSATVPL